MTASNGDKAGVEQLAFDPDFAAECRVRQSLLGAVEAQQPNVVLATDDLLAALRNQPARTDGASNDHAGLIERDAFSLGTELNTFILTRQACIEAVLEGHDLLASTRFAEAHPDVAKYISGIIDGLAGKVAEVKLDPAWKDGEVSADALQALSGASAREVRLEVALRQIAKVADEPRKDWSRHVGEIARTALSAEGQGS